MSSFALRMALAAALALSMALVGCGFHLRGEANYPFATLFLNSASTLPITTELKRFLDGSASAKLVPTAKEADAILELNSVEDTKQILSLSSGGKVAEYLLTKRVLFRVHDNDGKDWLPTAEVLVRRGVRLVADRLGRESEEQASRRVSDAERVVRSWSGIGRAFLSTARRGPPTHRGRSSDDPRARRQGMCPAR